MGDTSSDPIDHARTTRHHAGETMKNGANAPGLVLGAIGVVALVIALFYFARGNIEVAVTATVGAVVLLLVGGGWVLVAHRRVRARERQWLAARPHVDPEPPTS